MSGSSLGKVSVEGPPPRNSVRFFVRYFVNCELSKSCFLVHGGEGDS